MFFLRQKIIKNALKYIQEVEFHWKQTIIHDYMNDSTCPHPNLF